MHYLALGDSYTIGEGVEPEDRWPAQLAAHLRREGIGLADARIIATTGWTTDELAAGMDAQAPIGCGDGPWALVSLLIGVNNQYRGRSADEYRGEFAALLARAIALAGGRPSRVLVVSIPDWGLTPFARQQGVDAARVAAELDAYNAAAHDITAAQGAVFVDITDLSRAHGAQPDMLVDDGLHPSAAMYALWTARIAPAALHALATP